MSDKERHVKPSGELAQDPARLKRRRFLARLGLREAAGLAQINPGYLSLLENGHRSASPDVLHRLAGVYECGVEDIMPPEPNGAAA